MDLSERVMVFEKLGKISELLAGQADWPGYEIGVNEKEYDSFKDIIRLAYRKNPWFTEDNIRRSLKGISLLCDKNNINNWLSAYPQEEFSKTGNKKIAIVMAGNIPLVGFHDFLCVLLSGNTAVVKLSAQDDILLPALADILIKLAPDLEAKIEFIRDKKLENFDAVIATGSNNTARYFEYYFGKYPNIIRKNRTSVAVLHGTETDEELKRLGEDIFTYFGLGCRNVSKLFIPENFDLDRFFGSILDYSFVGNHNKYANNYDYHKALWLLNQDDLLDNGFVLLKRDERLASPVGSVFYERYSDIEKVEERLSAESDQIQCVVSRDNIPFGEAQNPMPWDYADNVDTMKFVLSL